MTRVRKLAGVGRQGLRMGRAGHAFLGVARALRASEEADISSLGDMLSKAVSENQGLRVLPRFLICGIEKDRPCFSESPLFPVVG